MKRLFILSITSLAVLCLKGQSINPTVVNTAGCTGAIGNLTFEFNLGESFTTTINNGLLITQGLLQPLQEPTGGPLPVQGLNFTAKRINQQLVQLNWSTLQEINNDGFFIERKKENENKFTSLRFITSRAPAGNSQLPLTYSAIDSNIFAGNTYYRIQQKDLNGQVAYSMIRLVGGIAGNTISLKAWPVPAKEFNVQLSGSVSETVLLTDAVGRVVRRMQLTGSQPFLVKHLPGGVYYLRVQQHTDVVLRVLVP